MQNSNYRFINIIIIIRLFGIKHTQANINRTQMFRYDLFFLM